MCGLLAYIGMASRFYPSLSSSTGCLCIRIMFEQTDIEIVDKIDAQSDAVKYSKHSCVQLYKIRVKYDGPQPRECFCASVRRKVWYKDFMVWYEKALRQVHQ